MAEQSKINPKSRSQFTRMPPNTVENPFAKGAPPPPKPPRPNRKRNLSNLDIHNAPYFKIRSLVQQLRPHFLEVLQTPDFQNCKGAYEIKRQMKPMMDLYKQMTMETAPAGILKNVSEHQPLPGAHVLGKDAQDGRRRRKQSNIHPLEWVTFEESLRPPYFGYDNRQQKGSYIVGGSPLGRNFITFGGKKLVYYGVTKEMHRSHLRQKKVNP